MRWDENVRIARIGRQHGFRGEYTVEVLTDSPETRFVKEAVFTVQPALNDEVTYRQLTLEQASKNKSILLSKFVEFSDRNTAESLRNCELYAEPEDSASDEDSWYADELIGLSVFQDHAEGQILGQVSNLITGEAQDLLEVRLADGGE